MSDQMTLKPIIVNDTEDYLLGNPGDTDETQLRIGGTTQHGRCRDVAIRRPRNNTYDVIICSRCGFTSLVKREILTYGNMRRMQFGIFNPVRIGINHDRHPETSTPSTI